MTGEGVSISGEGTEAIDVSTLGSEERLALYALIEARRHEPDAFTDESNRNNADRAIDQVRANFE